MFRYSLGELFYWLTFWIISVSMLGTLIPAHLAVSVVTVWLFGAVLTSEACGHWASFASAVLVGFVLMAVFRWPAITPFPRRHPNIEVHVMLSVVSGLISGTMVWCIAAFADEAFKSFARWRSSCAFLMLPVTWPIL
jgi:hypothetical protein